MRDIVTSTSRQREECAEKPRKPLHYMHPDDLRYSALQDCIAEAILHSRFTQQALARRIGVSESHLSKVINGQAGLHGEALVAFCKETRSVALWQWYSMRISEALQAEGVQFPPLMAAASPRLQ